MEFKSQLTQSLQNDNKYITPVHTGDVFALLRRLIKLSLNCSDNDTERLFLWLVHGKGENRNVCAMPIDITNEIPSWIDALPVVNALMFWSRIKFRLLASVNMREMREETRVTLLDYVKDIEMFIRHDAVIHFGLSINKPYMSKDDFCEFLLQACAMKTI